MIQKIKETLLKNHLYSIGFLALIILVSVGLYFENVNSSRLTENADGSGQINLLGARPAGQKIPGQYIVVYQDGVTNPDSTTDQLVKAQGLGLLYKYNHSLKGFAATIPAAKLEAVRKNADVQFISEDRTLSISPVQDNSLSTLAAQTLPTGIDRINADNKTNKGTGINVAIIDTGIDLSHPDLAANIVGGVSCLKGKKTYADDNGHGSHVAGTVAALDNGLGVVGVAPEAKLWAVRVLDRSGNGSWSSVICGVDFVTSRAPANGGPIRVANMSLGGSGSSDNNCGNSNNDALHKAICRSRDAGVVYVVAAGNESKAASSSVPAAYDDAVITVSALADSDGQSGGLGAATSYGPDDTFATFSNYGSVVDLAAPGVKIYSTWKSGTYSSISGTSMATPHVSGAVALYLKANPSAGWTTVRDALKSMGETLGSGHTDPSSKHPEPVVNVSTL